MQFDPVNMAFRAAGLAGVKATVVVESDPHCVWIATSGSGVSRFDWQARLWQTFTEADGLANTDVRSMLRTRSGELWFGTANGASCFDPGTQQWRSFFIADGLPNNSVWSLLEDSRGRIWMGTNGGGLSCYDAAADHWQTYTSQDGLAGNIVLALAEDSGGQIWVGTKTGLSQFNPATGQWLSFYQRDGLANDEVRSLAVDDSGFIWIGTVDRLSRFQPQQASWCSFGTGDGLGSDYIQALACRPGGPLWAGTRNGVSCYDAGARQWLTLTQSDGLSDNEVWGLLVDSGSRLWAATWGGGVSCYHPDTQRWDTYTAPVEFADTYAVAVIKSGNSHVWIGTYGAVSRYAIDTGAWQTLSSAQGLPNDNVQALIEDVQGNIWVGTSDGLVHYRPAQHSWSTCCVADGLANNDVNVLLLGECPQAMELWVGTACGLCCYRYGTGDWQAMTEQGLASANVLSLLLDSIGNFWVGTTQGLLVRNADGNWQRFDCAVGLLDLQVNALAEDEAGLVWIGTEGGLNCFVAATGQWRSFTQAQGLANNQVRALLIDGGGLWAGCASGGLSRYQLSTDTWQNLACLGSNDVSSLALDGAHNLWIATVGGGMTWITRHGAGAGFVQVFTAGNQSFSRQFWVSSANIALGCPGAIGVSEPCRPLADARVFPVAHNPLLAGACVDDQDLIWAASDEEGLSLIDLASGARTTVSHLPSRHVTALSATRDGDVWIGTATGFALATRRRLQAQLAKPNSPLPGGPVSGLAAVSEREVYVGFNQLDPVLFADAQVASSRRDTCVWLHYADSGCKPLSPAHDARSAFVRSAIRNMVWSPQSGLWIATSTGLYRCAPDQCELHRVELGGSVAVAVAQVVVAANGDAFALIDESGGGQAIVGVRVGSGQSTQCVQIQDLPVVSAIAVDPQGRLWISNGCYIFATTGPVELC